MNGRSHNGDILNDFGLAVSGEQDKTVSGKIGAGGPQIYLSADNGDVHIKKGPASRPLRLRRLRRKAARLRPLRARAPFEGTQSAARAAGYAVTAVVRAVPGSVVHQF